MAGDRVEFLVDFGPYAVVAAALVVWGAIRLLKELQGLADLVEGRLQKHPQLRARIARWLVMPSLYDGYRDWLGRELDRLDGWMGGYRSGTAFVRCWAIALGYPAALMVATYGAGGPGTVGTTTFFPPLEGWRQPVFGFGLLAVMAGAVLVMGFSERIDVRLKGRIARLLERRGARNSQRWADWLYRLVGAGIAASLWLAAFFLWFGEFSAVAVAVAGALTGAVALTGAGAVAVGGATAVAGAGALTGTGAVAVALAVPLALVSAGALAVLYLTGVNELSLAFLLLVTVLPLTNALLDWWSWWASRWLGRDLHDLMSGKERALGAMLKRVFGPVTMPVAFVLHVLADLVTAAAFLVGLAVLLPFAIELFNNAVEWFGEAAPLDLREYLDAAVADPWPEGAWALLMLFTTLFPTALHAGVALVTLFMWMIQPTAWRSEIVDGLEAEDEQVRSWAALKAAWLVILTPLVATVAVVGTGYVLWKAVGLVIGSVAGWLHAAALCGIWLADALAVTLGWAVP